MRKETTIVVPEKYNNLSEGDVFGLLLSSYYKDDVKYNVNTKELSIKKSFLEKIEQEK